jgi:hypothetical protein
MKNAREVPETKCKRKDNGVYYGDEIKVFDREMVHKSARWKPLTQVVPHKRIQ